MSEYEKHAIEFCQKTGTHWEITFLRKGRYFPDDKENRNIYYISLYRENHGSMHFTFGDSIANTRQHKRPNIYDILACLTTYDPGADMWDFAHEFGYEIHDEKSYKQCLKTFEAVRDEWQNVNNVFGDVLEELAEIQ